MEQLKSLDSQWGIRSPVLSNTYLSSFQGNRSVGMGGVNGHPTPTDSREGRCTENIDQNLKKAKGRPTFQAEFQPTLAKSGGSESFGPEACGCTIVGSWNSGSSGS
jgi:hypothetical protein